MTTLADAIANPASAAINPLMGEQADAASKSVVFSTGSKAKLDTLHNDIVALQGLVDGLEAAAAATNTKLDSLITAANDATDVGTAPHQPCDVVTFTPVVDTAAAYSSGDVLFTTTALTFARAVDMRANLVQITGIDKAKQNAAITLLFYQANVTSATINTANALSDTDQLTLLGSVDLAAADWKTWANNSTLCYSGAKAPNLLLEPVSTTQLVYIVGIVTSAATFTSTSDLTFKLGFIQQ